MTAINHALTGALIGLVVANPVVAIPLAFVSHFVLDAIPHFTDEKLKVASKNFNRYLSVDIMLCFLLVIVLAFFRPSSWLLASLCAFLATSPDFMWVLAYLRARRGNKFVLPSYFLARVHAKIQWFARPVGVYVEIAWFSGMVWILFVKKLALS